MNSPSSIYYYHGDGDYCNIMIQRHKENGKKGLECESCSLTEAEALLVCKWADSVFKSKAFRFTSMRVRGWTIFLPERKRNVRPLMSPLQYLVAAISRHEPMANDPAVIDAINAIEKELAGEPT